MYDGPHRAGTAAEYKPGVQPVAAWDDAQNVVQIMGRLSVGSQAHDFPLVTVPLEAQEVRESFVEAAQ